MALPIAYNPISLGQIQAEFGGSTPTQISEYYRQPSGPYTSANNTNVPTSGTIKFSDFYSAYRGYSVRMNFLREAFNQNYFYLNSPRFAEIVITTPDDGGGSFYTYSIPTNVIYTITSNPGTIIRTNFSSLYGTTGMQLEDQPENPDLIDWNDLEWYPELGTVYESGGNFYYVLNI
jgi:hypothetical protein